MVIIISYNKQTWNEYNDNQTADKNLANGAIISADKLNHMETGISNNDTNKVTDNKDGTEQLNGVKVQPFNKLSDTISGRNLLPGTSGTLQTMTNVTDWGPSVTRITPVVTTVDSDTSYTVRAWISPASHDMAIQLVLKEPSGAPYSECGNIISAGTSGYSVWTGVVPKGSTLQYCMIIFIASQSTASSVSYKEMKLEQGSIATDWTPAPEDKVNVSDMRKPASDVAGIDEVNTKQDKLTIIPADDSKVVHDNHDGTITANGTVFNLLHSLSASSIPQDPTKDYNTLPQGLALMSEVDGEPANMPPVKSTYLTLTIASSFVGGRKRQLAWLDAGATSSNNNYTYIRYCVGDTWSSWDSIPTSSQISSLLPSDIARTGQANTFNLTQTFSQGVKTLQTGSYDDANSLINEGLYYNTNSSIKNGARSITTGYIQVMSGYGKMVRQIMYSDTDGGLIYDRTSQDGGSSWSNWTQIVTWSQVPSNFALTNQSQTFRAAQTFSIAPTITDASKDKGDTQAATMADLKSVEKSAWHQLDNKYIIPASGYTLAPITCILYKIDDSTHKLYLSGAIALTNNSANNVSVTIQLGSIVKSILTFTILYVGYASGSTPNLGWRNPTQSSTNLSFVVSGGDASIAVDAANAGSFVTYDKLV